MSADIKKLEEQFNAERDSRLTQACENHSEFYNKYNNRKVKIMGIEWTIKVVPDTDERLSDVEANGLCEAYSKEIYVKDLTDVHDPRQFLNIEKFVKKVLRHEIVHCVFFEAGQMQYFDDEKLTEVLAHLVPKMSETMAELELL